MEALIEKPAPPPRRRAATREEESLARIVPSPLRADLIIRKQFFRNEEYYVIKDPLALSYFRLAPEEAYLAGLMDGKRTVRELAELFERKFPNTPRPVEEIAAFTNQLGVGGLLNVNAQRFVESARRLRSPGKNLLMIWIKVISGFIFFKIPLIDPSPWLGRLSHAFRFLWTRWFVSGCLLLFLWTFGLLIAHREAFAAHRIDFFSQSNLLLLWVAIVLIKTCHEFGHAMTCRHFGGEVHEMGVALLCFTPAGYVDASDAWMMRHKRHKLYTTCAGVFTELVIASIAAHFWLFLPDGLPRSLAFNAMLVASINTIVFNANPLMRFDGYYVACDLLEIPNLRSKAISFCSYHLQRIFLGYRNRTQEANFGNEANGRVFVVYAIFAYIYMIFIIWGLTQVFARVLKPYGLHDFGLLLGFFVEGSFVMFPFIKIGIDAVKPGAHIVKEGSARKRLLFSVVLIAAVVGGTFFVPTHFKVTQQAVLLAESGEVVASPVGGRVAAVHVETGQWVEPGQRLATLENPEITAQLELRRAELAQAQLRYFSLQRHDSWQAMETQVEAAKMLEVAIAGLERAQAGTELLEIRATVAGYVLSPNVKHLIGNYLQPTQALLRIGDTRALKIIIPLTEDQAQLVNAGSAVEGRWVGSTERFSTQIRAIPGQLAKSTEYHPAMLSMFGGPAPLSQTGADSTRLFPLFVAEASVPTPDHLVLEGMRLRVKIEGRETTVGKKCWRWLVSLWNLKVNYS